MSYKIPYFSQKAFFFAVFIFFCFINLTAQQTSMGGEEEEDLPILMTSEEVTSKDIRPKKNIIGTLPLQFFQKTLPISYERILGDNKHGLMFYYYRVTKDNVNDFNLQYRWYFKESELKDFNFDQLHIKGFYMEYYTGINYQFATKGSIATLNALTVPIGARMQFKKGFNFSITGLVGYGRQQGNILEPNFLSHRLLIALGYRF